MRFYLEYAAIRCIVCPSGRWIAVASPSVTLAILSEGHHAFVLCYSIGADVPWERSYGILDRLALLRVTTIIMAAVP